MCLASQEGALETHLCDCALFAKKIPNNSILLTKSIREQSVGLLVSLYGVWSIWFGIQIPNTYLTCQVQNKEQDSAVLFQCHHSLQFCFNVITVLVDSLHTAGFIWPPGYLQHCLPLLDTRHTNPCWLGWEIQLLALWSRIFIIRALRLHQNAF